MARSAVNYDVNPGALKTIEGKLRQMQATGANITPEMMQALYSSVLEVGADKAGRSAVANASLEQRRSEFNQSNELRKEAMKSEENRGMANAIGKMALYGGRYADKKGYLDPLKFWQDKPGVGGTTTPESLKTVGGHEFGTQPTQPSLLGDNPLGLGDPTSMELTPAPTGELLSSAPGPGPVTAPPVTTGTPVLPSLEPGAGIIPGVGNVGGETLGTTIPSVTPDIGATAANFGAETLSTTAPELATEVATSMAPDIGATAAGTEALASAAPELGIGAFMGPMGAGALATGAAKAFGVDDDIGKALLFGGGGEKEQSMASGLATGAGAGALAGTYIFPGVGTAVGGILGAIGGGLSSVLDDLF